MKRLFLLGLLVTGMTVCLTGRGQEAPVEKPHLELVRALRAKGYSDLALDYLDGLAKNGPATLKPFVPLEKARVRLDMADREPNLGARAGLYNQARQEFLDFIKNRPDDPLAAEAQLEATRILMLEGRAQMRQSQKLPPGDLEAMVEKAGKQFKLARAELEKALEALDAALPKATNDKLKKSLLQAKSLAKLENLRNVLDLASTYEPLNLSLAERGKLINDTITKLEAFADEDRKDPIGNQARAWVGKAHLDLDNPAKAKDTFDVVLKLTGPEAEDARRLARYFQFMQGVDPRKPAPADQVQAMGEEWLKLYPNQRNTPEGQALRYALANSYMKSGQAMHKPPAPPSPAAKAAYTKALDQYRALESPENEYTEDASGNRLKITIALNVGADNLREIKEFGQAFMGAQAQVAKLGEAEQKFYRLKAQPNPTQKEKEAVKEMEAKWPEERKQFLRLIRDFLLHARSLADAKTPSNDLAECYANLVYVNMALGEPEKGAVIGEYAARHMPHVSKASAAAAYALQAYGQMIADRAGVDDDKWVKTDEDRLLKLAEYMEKVWPNDTNTDAARHQVGTMMLQRKRAKEAVTVLSRVSSGYKPAASLTDARWWWAYAAEQMLREPNLTDEERKFYQDQARLALEGIPEVPTNVPAGVAQMYILAKMQFCNTLFEAKKYDELDKHALVLKKKLAAFEIPEDVRERLQPNVDLLGIYAQFGRATLLLNTNQAKKAEDLCDEVIPKFSAQVKKTKADLEKARKEHDALENAANLTAQQKETLEDLKQDVQRLTYQVNRESQLLRGFLTIAMRASVQNGNIANAQRLLVTLRNAASESVGAQVYVQLVAQLKDQIEDLQAAKKTKELNELIQNFRAFLEALAKEKPSTEMIFFIANVYRQLELPNDAATILERLVDPGARGDDKAIEAYRAGKMMQAQLYRLAKNYTKAAELISKIEGEPWAGTRIMREKAFLNQDQEKWGPAAVAWRNIMDRLGPHLQQPKLKEQYYDCYFNYIKCLYKYALNYQNPKLNAAEVNDKKREYIERAAKLILKVEEVEPANMGAPGLKEEYEKLLKDNPLLQKEYDKAKKEAPAVGEAKQ
jgi:hypothetical protein